MGKRMSEVYFLSALRQIGARYIADVRKLAPTGERVTDMMPSNYYFAGLIYLALPNAKIIHSIRNCAAHLMVHCNDATCRYFKQ